MCVSVSICVSAPRALIIMGVIGQTHSAALQDIVIDELERRGLSNSVSCMSDKDAEVDAVLAIEGGA